MKIYLNIGTNLGNRIANLKHAILAIESELHCKAVVSDIISSVPWGFASKNFFYNQGVMIDVDIEPYELLDTTQKIEKNLGSKAHRDAAGNYLDRIIDIDIVDMEGVKIRSERLVLPHPHLYDRPFFLIPYLMLKGF
ncbi:MAG: 2-amino-4-hydroxy-6-hydroxymethyldihydropteridine diphosphokinase [Muribaculaceae bacterium]|nr:2-amino-4-hydroxy-6-hydroxymethyldihydropteridine diphosphokinase [Muribaculaceae bacterium]